MNYCGKAPEGYIKKLMAREVAPAPNSGGEEWAPDLASSGGARSTSGPGRCSLSHSNESWTSTTREVRRRFALNHDVTEQIIAAMDLDGDGKVQLHEWAPVFFAGRGTRMRSRSTVSWPSLPCRRMVIAKVSRNRRPRLLEIRPEC